MGLTEFQITQLLVTETSGVKDALRFADAPGTGGDGSSRANTSSARGQLERPSDVNSSTMTGLTSVDAGKGVPLAAIVVASSGLSIMRAKTNAPTISNINTKTDFSRPISAKPLFTLWDAVT